MKAPSRQNDDPWASKAPSHTSASGGMVTPRVPTGSAPASSPGVVSSRLARRAISAGSLTRAINVRACVGPNASHHIPASHRGRE